MQISSENVVFYVMSQYIYVCPYANIDEENCV